MQFLMSFLMFIEDDELEKPSFEKKPINIEEDMEMYSKFLERKVIRTGLSKAYIS